VVHCYARSEGVAGVIITKDYPNIAAHSVLSKLMDEFLAEKPIASIQGKTKDNEVPFPKLKEYIVKYQDSNEASSIAKIQQELDETKIVLHKAIDSVCIARVNVRDMVHADPLSGPPKRREARRLGRQERRSQRAEQGLLQDGQEAELLLRRHVICH
jgi:hypothetical protein